MIIKLFTIMALCSPPYVSQEDPYLQDVFDEIERLDREHGLYDESPAEEAPQRETGREEDDHGTI